MLLNRNIERINSLPDDKTVGLYKSKAFADEESNVTQILETFPDMVENTGGV